MKKRTTFERELSIEEGISIGSSESEYVAMPASRQTFLLIAVISIVIVGTAVIRAGLLHFVSGTFYANRANANVSREIVLPTRRAEILARNGEVMAKNANSFSVFLNIQSFVKAGEKGNELLSRLATILGFPATDIKQLILGADFERDTWIPIERTITLAEAIEVRSLESTLKTSSIIRVVDDFERQYNNGPALAHVVGYTGVTDGNAIVGKSGLEYTFDDLIRGEDGTFVVYEDAHGTSVDERILREPKPAPALTTTIDLPLQNYFYNRFKQGLSSLDRTAGTGIILNPKNGEVLSLVSFPSFDPNIFVNPARRVERGSLLIDPLKPLFNRAISGVYSPGSAVKPLVALAALKEGVVDKTDQILSTGALTIPNPYDATKPSIFLDWKAHGWVNIVSALARSSNVYFYVAGGGVPAGVPVSDLVLGSINTRGLGIDRLKSYWEKFGFGSKTNIDLPFEAKGFLPDPTEKLARTNEPWRIGDTYNVSIGQGDFAITPIELAEFVASVANGGKLWEPHLLLDEDPTLVADYSDWADEFAVVHKGLEAAVKDPAGSSHLLNDLPIAVAGKTGTPQIANKARINALFTGYGPVGDPEIAIVILIENAREGSVNTLPIAKDVFRWYYENRMQTETDTKNAN